ncbi:uncharacterized protein [Arachis hypogaea]|uniref:uncharacterized protein n=1 Tax=Arachis hypogaea TaxID=3818 RepID=UPI003B222DC0
MFVTWDFRIIGLLMEGDKERERSRTSAERMLVTSEGGRSEGVATCKDIPTIKSESVLRVAGLVEILDENERPNLHGAIQNYMVHRLCGPYNKNSPCMKNGSCSKFYPKEFRQRTLIDEAGFSKYRRTYNGRTVKKRECVLDNKFIVLYNLELLLKFGCHINVEYTFQTSSIKYLFKYVHKGNDRVTATLYNAGDPSEATQVVDEIRNYYDCRYISACEAVWRLFGYEIQEKEPFVIRLPFHLVNEQPVVYGETSNVNDIVERAISHKSMFLGWMAANMSYPYA